MGKILVKIQIGEEIGLLVDSIIMRVIEDIVEVEVIIEEVILVEEVFAEELIHLEEVSTGIGIEKIEGLGDSQDPEKEKELGPNQV